ncbi:MAG: cytochrome P450 [Myxococcota bacterium]
MVEYDPYAYQTHEDPYPIYRDLREKAPLYRNERLGFWALSRHSDVLAALRNPVAFSNAQGVSLDRSSHAQADTVMSFLAMDPPRHTQMRALVSRAFTPRRVAGMEPRIRELSRKYVARFAERGRFDVIADYAGLLPMAVISELIGVPEADRQELRSWADTVVHREEGMSDVPPAGMEAAARLLGYFAEFVRERRARPHDDLLGALFEAEIDGERLAERDIIAFVFLMIIAGNETTTKLIGNAVYWLWRNPEQRARICRDPRLVARWVEETLRYDNSTQALARTLARDVELYGEKLRPGEKLLLLLGSANRDEDVFERAEEFDILRNTTASLSFGHGTHFCLGASLARLEGRVALDELHRFLPTLEVRTEEAVRVHSCNVRGFAALPVEFEP